LIKVDKLLTIDEDFNIVHEDKGIVGKIMLQAKDSKLYFVRKYSKGVIDGVRLQRIIKTLAEQGYINIYTKEYKDKIKLLKDTSEKPQKRLSVSSINDIVESKISKLTALLEEKEKARIDSFTKLINILVKELSEVKQAVNESNDLSEIADLIGKIGDWDEKSRNLMLTMLELKKKIA